MHLHQARTELQAEMSFPHKQPPCEAGPKELLCKLQHLADSFVFINIAYS